MVASVFIVCIFGLTGLAVWKYNVDGALKLWAAVGTAAGVIATYFFQRNIIESAKADAAAERFRANEATEKVEASLAAVGVLERYVDPAARNRMSQEEVDLVDRAFNLT
jgi:hypothetical protein